MLPGFLRSKTPTKFCKTFKKSLLEKLFKICPIIFVIKATKPFCSFIIFENLLALYSF